MRRLLVILVALVAVCSFLYYSGFVEGFVTGFEGHAGLPACDSSHGKDDAKRAVENSPFAKSNNLTIIGVINPKTITANDMKVECQATALLNSAKQVVMDYSFTKQPGLAGAQYLIRASLDADTVKPFP